MRGLDAIGHALAVAGSMTWQITWSLILGFTLSAVVQAVVRRQTIARLLGNDRPKALALVTGTRRPALLARPVGRGVDCAVPPTFFTSTVLAEQL